MRAKYTLPLQGKFIGPDKGDPSDPVRTMFPEDAVLANVRKGDDEAHLAMTVVSMDQENMTAVVEMDAPVQQHKDLAKWCGDKSIQAMRSELRAFPTRRKNEVTGEWYLTGGDHVPDRNPPENTPAKPD